MKWRIWITCLIMFYIRYSRLFWKCIKKSWGNPSIRTYKNKIEKRITFKIKTEYYLELLIPEAMKFPGSTKSKITKDENGENAPI